MQTELRDQETQADALPVQPPQPVQQIVQLPPQQPFIEEHAFKQTTTKRSVDNEFSERDDVAGKVSSLLNIFGKAIIFSYLLTFKFINLQLGFGL